MENRRKLSSLGYSGILLALIMILGIVFINREQMKRAQSGQVLEAARNLPSFSLIRSGEVDGRVVYPLPVGALPANSRDEMLVTVDTIATGETLSRSNVISLGAPSSVDLVALPFSNTIEAQPGDEIGLIGVDEKGSVEELGTVVFLGTKNEQMIVTLCPKIALRSASYHAEKRSLMAVRLVSLDRPPRSAGPLCAADGSPAVSSPSPSPPNP